MLSRSLRGYICVSERGGGDRQTGVHTLIAPLSLAFACFFATDFPAVEGGTDVCVCVCNEK